MQYEEPKFFTMWLQARGRSSIKLVKEELKIVNAAIQLSDTAQEQDRSYGALWVKTRNRPEALLCTLTYPSTMQHSMDIDFFGVEEEKVVFRNPGNVPICLTGVISKHMITSERSLDERHESGLPNSLPENIIIGDGIICKNGSTVKIKYMVESGRDGRKIDQGKMRFTIGTGAVIEGMDLAIEGMRVGGHRIARIPAALAYATENGASVVGRPGRDDGKYARLKRKLEELHAELRALNAVRTHGLVMLPDEDVLHIDISPSTASQAIEKIISYIENAYSQAFHDSGMANVEKGKRMLRAYVTAGSSFTQHEFANAVISSIADMSTSLAFDGIQAAENAVECAVWTIRYVSISTAIFLRLSNRSTNSISPLELLELQRALFQEQSALASAAAQLLQADTNGDGMLNMEQFVDFGKRCVSNLTQVHPLSEIVAAREFTLLLQRIVSFLNFKDGTSFGVEASWSKSRALHDQFDADLELCLSHDLDEEHFSAALMAYDVTDTESPHFASRAKALELLCSRAGFQWSADGGQKNDFEFGPDMSQTLFK
eukprot:g1632.t1